MKLPVFDQKGKEKSHIEIDTKVFDGKINNSLIHQAVVTFLANQRKSTAVAKTRGQVRGGGKKPWRQKGTGRARVGSIRSPLWRGGGVVFGPQSRSYRQQFPKRMSVMALKSALNAKLRDQQIMVLQDVKISEPKTKEFFGILKKLQLTKQKTRFVVSTMDATIKRSSRNIPNTFLIDAQSLTTYDVLDCNRIIFTQEALKGVEEKIKKWLK